MKKKYADMDSLEEVRAIKEELAREFPTAQAFGEYLRKNYPMKSTPKAPCSGRRTASKAGKRPASRRRKTAVHA